MRESWRRTVALAASVVAVMFAIAGPVSADSSGTTQIGGVGEFSDEGCDPPPEPFTDLTLTLSGSLIGCWYTDVTSFDWNDRSGIYQEEGSEYFVGCLDPEKRMCGTFETTYRFTARYEPDPGSELPDPDQQLNGRCQHPLIKGSGTGVFAGATGRLDFKDDVEAGNVHYRGHIKFG